MTVLATDVSDGQLIAILATLLTMVGGALGFLGKWFMSQIETLRVESRDERKQFLEEFAKKLETVLTAQFDRVLSRATTDRDALMKEFEGLHRRLEASEADNRRLKDRVMLLLGRLTDSNTFQQVFNSIPSAEDDKPHAA